MLDADVAFERDLAVRVGLSDSRLVLRVEFQEREASDDDLHLESQAINLRKESAITDNFDCL